MESNSLINSRLKQINDLKLLLNRIDGKLSSVTHELKWDYKKLFEEEPSNMVICSVNNQHRVPQSRLSSHEEKCRWRQEGYGDDDKFFPEHSGSGSFVTLTSDLLKSITAHVTLPSVFLYLVFKNGWIHTKYFCIFSKNTKIESVKKFLIQVKMSEPDPPLRSVPETSAKFDQDFSRQEKLAIYDYVINNTVKQRSFSDLCFQSAEKKEENEKKEMAPWEIAAAERDAKRRRISYRKKVHTSHKSQTEILREVIEVQMELLREEISDSRLSTTDKSGKDKEDSDRKHRRDSRSSKEYSKHSNRETSSRRDDDDRHKSRSHDRHSKHSEDRTRRRSQSFTGSDSHSRSRSHDRFRKRKPHDGRSHSHKSKKHSRKDTEYYRNSFRHGERERD